MRKTVLFLALAATGWTQPLVVHEWGTFTSLQDEKGRCIGAINVDDEPVPAFVHDLGNLVADGTPGGVASKALPPNLASVTMRLETPVLYFHLPPGQTSAKVDVEVGFKGGWLSQFYPKALAEAPGVEKARQAGPSATTLGRLRWPGLQVGGKFTGPATDSVVWKAPRQAKSDPVTAQSGEKEQFLFYRGIGHVDSPMQVTSDATSITARPKGDWTVPQAWLVEVAGDGSVAFVSQGAFQKSARMALPRGKARLADLRASMKKALITDGLFADEAQAMLDAWQVSYFQSPGRRLFFIVPKSWTDEVLPLTVRCDGPVKTQRVMIGRVELITPQQRQDLQLIRRGGGAEVYERLGRFRRALVALPAGR